MTARLRCTVESMNYSACELAVGDSFDLGDRGVELPEGSGFCMFAIAAVASALAGRDGSESLDAWLAREPLVACPDPPENLVLRVRALPEKGP